MNNGNGEILAALSKQVSELREMNVSILREATSIQAVLNTLLTLQAQEDDSALEIYRTQFFSMRATIAAGSLPCSKTNPNLPNSNAKLPRPASDPVGTSRAQTRLPLRLSAS
jgi:hypothetical protein